MIGGGHSRVPGGTAGLALAACALLACGHDSPTTDVLLRDLRSDDEKVFERAKQALIEGGPAVWSELVDRLESQESHVASDAGHTLTFVDVRPVALKLRRLLQSSDPRAHFWAAVDLAGLDLDDAHLVPYLTDGLYLDEIDPKSVALVYLGFRVRSDALGAAPRLIEGLRLVLLDDKKSTSTHRGNAARTLGRIGKPGLPALMAASKVPRADWWAVDGLQEMGPAVAEAAMVLREIANQPIPEDYEEANRVSQLRDKAADALRKIQRK